MYVNAVIDDCAFMYQPTVCWLCWVHFGTTDRVHNYGMAVTQETISIIMSYYWGMSGYLLVGCWSQEVNMHVILAFSCMLWSEDIIDHYLQCTVTMSGAHFLECWTSSWGHPGPERWRHTLASIKISGPTPILIFAQHRVSHQPLPFFLCACVYLIVFSNTNIGYPSCLCMMSSNLRPHHRSELQHQKQPLFGLSSPEKKSWVKSSLQ